MKRIFLTLTFVAALAAAGLGMSSTAEADHSCGYGGYGYRSYNYPSYYSYYDGYDYGPRFSYYRSYGHRGYDGHHGYHDRGHSGVYFSIGF